MSCPVLVNPDASSGLVLAEVTPMGVGPARTGIIKIELWEISVHTGLGKIPSHYGMWFHCTLAISGSQQLVLWCCQFSDPQDPFYVLLELLV